MKVPFNDLTRQHSDEIAYAIDEVIGSGKFIQGEEVEKFEHDFAEYHNKKYCVSVASGTDALTLALKAHGICKGDKVLVPAMTFIATPLAVARCAAEIVFVDVDNEYVMDYPDIHLGPLKNSISVDLYGAMCYATGVYEMKDCCQSAGLLQPKYTTDCYSFYPTKPLGCYGDGGAVVTNDRDVADNVRLRANYGSNDRIHYNTLGMNSRLDEIQAAILNVKLKSLASMNTERRIIAQRYINGINNPKVILPEFAENHAWHLFVVRVEERVSFVPYLFSRGIQAMVHYPVPCHLQPIFADLEYKEGDFPNAEKYCNEVVSLPCFNGMRDDEIDYVIEKVNEWR